MEPVIEKVPAQPTAATLQPSAPTVQTSALPATAAKAPPTAAQADRETRAVVAERLLDLSRTNSPEALKEILSQLGNSDSVIRAEALNATIQFGSRDAIPELERVAAQTENPEEKSQLLDAAEYLKLPSYTELRRQRKAAAAPATVGLPQARH